MAVQFSTSGGGYRSARARRRRPPMSEIYVTPMVDVMLVLLIVFMIAAPLLTVGVEVDLPDANVGEISGTDEPIEVSIQADGSIYLQETVVQIHELGPRLVAISQNNPDVRIFVRGDRGVAYGEVMAVMGALNEAGFNHLALEAERPREAVE
ncbi:MAG: ExbD/TolR family protein [Alphaproteobacteria bacterium]|nr:ExbD/TolR family protein [Alphaproteobacteria bacterium]